MATTPRIIVRFAGQCVSVTLAQASVEDADGFMTDVACLRARTGAVALGAAVRVLWSGDLRTRGGQLARHLADNEAKWLRKIGYVDVRVERA